MSNGNDPDIERLALDSAEKALLQMHRNYTKAFQRKRAEQVGEEASQLGFDFERFEADLDAIEQGGLEHALLAAIAVADDLLAAMYRRERRERLQVKDLLSPLGPLGDFNKRLKVAALANIIDEDTLSFFDELRKARNRIAHSPRPQPPTALQVRQLIDAAPVWLEVFMVEETMAKIDRTSENTLKAAILVHLAKLAWMTLLNPLARRADVPLTILLERPRRPEVFVKLSKLGIGRARNLLR
jgi:hypothetical protein